MTYQNMSNMILKKLHKSLKMPWIVMTSIKSVMLLQLPFISHQTQKYIFILFFFPFFFLQKKAILQSVCCLIKDVLNTLKSLRETTELGTLLRYLQKMSEKLIDYLVLLFNNDSNENNSNDKNNNDFNLIKHCQNNGKLNFIIQDLESTFEKFCNINHQKTKQFFLNNHNLLNDCILFLKQSQNKLNQIFGPIFSDNLRILKQFEKNIDFQNYERYQNNDNDNDNKQNNNDNDKNNNDNTNDKTNENQKIDNDMQPPPRKKRKKC